MLQLQWQTLQFYRTDIKKISFGIPLSPLLPVQRLTRQQEGGPEARGAASFLHESFELE